MHASRDRRKRKNPHPCHPILFANTWNRWNLLQPTAPLHKSLSIVAQSSPNPIASLQRKCNKSSKDGPNADKLSCCASFVCRLSGCGNRCGTASNGAVSCDESKVGASKSGSVIAMDHNGAIAEERGRALGGGEVEIEVAKI